MNTKQLIKELEDLRRSVIYLDKKMIKAELGLITKKLNKEKEGEQWVTKSSMILGNKNT